MSDRTETLDRTAVFEGTRASPGLVVVYAGGGGALADPVALPETLTLGRSGRAGLTLDDPSASREHVRIAARDGGFEVTDLGSRNGTRLDGRDLASGVPAALAVGSVLRVGNTLLVVVADVAPYLDESAPSSGLVGGAALTSLRVSIDEAARTVAPVLIGGETGVGKELVAHEIHRRSGRRGALVPVNCAAIPGQLVESELFGHARGAFTGSERARLGLFRSADGGTLLLDEVGELPLDVQARLLRALESGEVRAVGEDAASRVSVKLVCATNRRLDALVAQGRFREDLYHRIAGLRVEVSPLRARRTDVLALATHLMGPPPVSLSPGVAERLLTHAWPGNVRELRSVVSLAVDRARTRGASRVEERDLGPLGAPPPEREAPARRDPDEVLRGRISSALSRHGGNVSRAAQELQMRRAGLYEALKRLGLRATDFRKG